MKKILNILLGVILLITVILTVYAMVAGGSNEAINLNLIWSYILIAVGIATALFTAVWGMVNSSKGIKGTLLSTLLIIRTSRTEASSRILKPLSRKPAFW